MKKLFNLLLSSGLLVGVVATPCAAEEVREFIHDPSEFFHYDDRLIGYGSGTEGIPLRGIELVLEERLAEHYVPVFEEEIPEWIVTIQEWNPTNEFDAPAVYKDGRFIFYTVYDETDEEGVPHNIQDAIGVVENTGTPEAPQWKDLGIVVQSKGEELGKPRAMDPAVISTKGRLYLMFGSHAGGIYIAELDEATMKLKQAPEATSTAIQPERFVHLAQHMASMEEESEIEAGYLYEHDGHYYLFVNWGGCCSGVDSTYNVRIGRATNVLGPYYDKDGKDMAKGGGSLFVQAEGRYIGPGHIGILEFNEEEGIITYHYYDREDNGVAKLAVRELFWSDDGWPMLGEHLIEPN